MSRLLRIDSSPRTQGSRSRELADDLVARWRTANPGGEIVVRDLAADPVPHMEQSVLGVMVDPDQAGSPLLALSNELVAELKSADEILVSAPMYNFTVPSALKAWIDHIVRFGLTFEVLPEGGFRGLLEARKVWIVTSAGGVYSEGPFQAMDHLGPYLETLFGFMGVEDVTRIGVENTMDPEGMEASRTAARAKLDGLLG